MFWCLHFIKIARIRAQDNSLPWSRLSEYPPCDMKILGAQVIHKRYCARGQRYAARLLGLKCTEAADLMSLHETMQRCQLLVVFTVSSNIKLR